MILARVDERVRIASYGGMTDGDSRLATVDFQQILAAARQLSKSSQAKLVSALLQEPEAAHTPALAPLTGLSEAELGSLAASVSAPAHARRLQQLLRLHREKKLTRALRAELDALLEESDRIALVKAKANYTLSLRKA
jgi:hypothetical protein